MILASSDLPRCPKDWVSPGLHWDGRSPPSKSDVQEMIVLNEFLLELLQLWVHLFLMGHQVWGLVCGFSLLAIWLFRKSRFWFLFAWPAVISAAIAVPILAAFPEMTEFLGGRRIEVPDELTYWFIGGLFFPSASLFLLSRYGGQFSSWIASGLTKTFALQRAGRTDVRTVSSVLPGVLQDAYDPAKFFRSEKGVFIGLDECKSPIYIPTAKWRSSHVQIVGTTGSGKGVAAGVLLSQAVVQGEAVVIVDPKADEFLPAVMAASAKQADVPFVYLDLTASKAQWSPFRAKSEQEIEELLTAGLGMGDTGSDADVYRVEDRRVARRFAAFCSQHPNSIHSNFADFFAANPELIDSARKLHADLEELVFTPCVQASMGIDLQALLEAGAVIYVRGSTRNPRIIKLQKIFLLSCMQAVEVRDRAKARHVAFFLDELKYLLSRAAIEALGAIRDKRAHVLVAHQTLGDLEDCGKDLSAKAVIGAVVENCAIKLAYQARDPDTALWLSRLSGTILVDDETRTIESNLGLTEKQSQRTLRQAERPLIDINQLLMLPNRTAVLFGVGYARFIYTSPIKVDVTAFKIEPEGEVVKQPEGKQTLAGSLLDVD